MPKKEQQIIVAGTDRETLLLQSYQTMVQLGWDIQYAGENALMARTPKNWKTYGTEVIVNLSDNLITISSALVHGEMFDLGGKNQKQINFFVQEFEKIKNSPHSEQNNSAHLELVVLQENTRAAIEQETKDIAEVDAVMNISKGNLYVTYGIIGLNVLVFVLMLLDGAGVFEPNGLVHLKWGSNFKPLTFGGEWWRLLTSVFIHFGILHLAFNMYALYSIGIYLEPMLGKLKYIGAYLCTGIFAGMASLILHKDPTNSAGASGAIFGMYGLFLAFLTTNLIPKKVRQPLLQSIGVFVIFNLAYGFKSGIDNAAHAGGLVSGFIIGYLYVFGIKKEKDGKPMQWLLPVIMLGTIGAAFWYLQKNKTASDDVQQIKKELKAVSFKDELKFHDQLVAFDKLHEEIQSIYKDSMLSDVDLKDSLTNITIPKLDKATAMIKEATALEISPGSKIKANKILDYLGYKKTEFRILLEMIGKDKAAAQELLKQSEEARTAADNLFAEILKL